MSETTYNVIAPETGVPVKAWTKGVPLEDAARKQLLNAAQLPFIFKWIAAMPDVHWGIGATVGSVIPTKGAIIPAAVGVDIGCGMMAVQTSAISNALHCIRNGLLDCSAELFELRPDRLGLHGNVLVNRLGNARLHPLILCFGMLSRKELNRLRTQQVSAFH